jgi:hypothetical protein
MLDALTSILCLSISIACVGWSEVVHRDITIWNVSHWFVMQALLVSDAGMLETDEMQSAAALNPCGPSAGASPCAS